MRKIWYFRFARNVFGVTEVDDETAALAGIESMAKYFKSLGMPSKLSDFNIGEEHIDALALNCTYNNTRTVKSYIPLGFKEIKEIFELCK